MKNKKIKIILLSLPIPEFYNFHQKGNHQLFKDYFKSFLKVLNINDFEIIDIPRNIVDNFNNRGITKIIKSLNPDIVGFSSYLWNIERNIQISKELRKEGIITITGGPEIQLDNSYIFSNNAFDFYIIGEGEYKLLYLLNFIKNNTYKINYDKNNYNKFNLYKHIDKKYNINDFQILSDTNIKSDKYEKLKDLFIKNYQNMILNYIEISKDYKTDNLFYFETERGCLFNCSFCAYSKFRKDILSLPNNVFSNMLLNILKKDIEEVYILSPTLNRNKNNFKYLLRNIIELQTKLKPKVNFFGELRSEFLTKEDIVALSNASFNEIEFGVQSLKNEVLININRNSKKIDLPEFVKILRENNIKPIIDFIIGLPNESYDDIINTINYLDDYNLLEYASFYHLLILPSTDLKFQFIEKKYNFESTPPYLALKTDKLDIEKIRNLYMYLESEKDISYYDEFLFSNKDKIYITNNLKHFNNLENTYYYHTANFLFYDKLKKMIKIDIDKYILNFYNNFLKKNSDIFHILYLISFKNLDYKFLNMLKNIFKLYKNYYDKFHQSIDFFNDELFSKRIEVLTKPEIFMKYFKKLSLDFNFNFIYFKNEKDKFMKDYQFLETIYNEYGIYTYLEKDINIYQISSALNKFNQNIQSINEDNKIDLSKNNVNFIKFLPINFNN